MTETEELKLKTEMVQNIGARIFFAEKALRSIALNHAEAARSGVTEALNCLDGKLPNSAPAEPSGNTGELRCATCRDMKVYRRKSTEGYRDCPDCTPAIQEQTK